MGARADRLDPHARMGMSNERVRFEAKRMQRVPEPAIDKLQEAELRRRQNAAGWQMQQDCKSRSNS